MQDLTVVIPCHEEDHEILKKIRDELTSLGAEVIIVDDGSKEPIQGSLKHGSNFGYGSAIMTGIKNSDRPLILTMDGDGQHTAQEAIKLYHAFKLMGNADMVIGFRRLKDEKLHRFLGRKFLNWIASFVCCYWVLDLNSGARIFKRSVVLGYFPILCHSFSFTTSLTISMMADKYKVEWFPIEIKEREHGKSKVKLVKDGLTTLRYILWIGFALRTRRIRAWFRSMTNR